MLSLESARPKHPHIFPRFWDPEWIERRRTLRYATYFEHIGSINANGPLPAGIALLFDNNQNALVAVVLEARS